MSPVFSIERRRVSWSRKRLVCDEERSKEGRKELEEGGRADRSRRSGPTVRLLKEGELR